MGYIQYQIIKIGKEKGFITSEDVAQFYQSSKVKIEMNKLVALGCFYPAEDCGIFIKWKFKREQYG